jgi:hypothetical protein
VSLSTTILSKLTVSYFPDLAPYSYGHYSHPGVLHVGWLDGVHAFPKGYVDRRLVEKLKFLATKPVELYRGKHLCEVCVQPEELIKTYFPNRGKLVDPESPWAKWTAQRSSNGEIRVASGGITYAAPVLIVHYIEEHGYLPPAQFLEAIDKAGERPRA